MDGTLRKPRVVHNETVDSIVCNDDRRSIDLDAVERLKASMLEIGLRVPISVRPADDCNVLVTGAHRLHAAKALGWEWIECFHVDGDETDARMEEIAENLHRAELTALERDEQVAEWARLLEEKLARVVPVSGGRGNIGGERKVARDLGITRTNVQRAKKVASLSGKAKQAARDEGLDDNQTALLDAAKHDTPEAQVIALQTRKPQQRADDPLNDFEASERQVRALMSAWNKASPEARAEFMARIDRPTMDRAGWGSR